MSIEAITRSRQLGGLLLTLLAVACRPTDVPVGDRSIAHAVVPDAGTSPDAAVDTRASGEADASTASKGGSGEPADAGDEGRVDDFEHDAAPLVLAHRTLAGPCVDPVAHTGSEEHLEIPRKQWPGVYETWLENRDLDGDGQGEWVVERMHAECDHALRLYVRRGDCGYFVGTLVGLDFAPMKASTNDLHDVTVESLSCPISHRKHYCRSTWKFDGHTYAPASERLAEAPRVPVEVVDPHAGCE
jgi:hypothetical protein